MGRGLKTAQKAGRILQDRVSRWEIDKGKSRVTLDGGNYSMALED